jgi:hypothetical protein
MRRFCCPFCSAYFLVPEGSEGLWIHCPNHCFQPVLETAPALGEDWPALANVWVLWDCLRWKASERKARLFACACLRRLDHLLSREHRGALCDYERFADGLLSAEELQAVTEPARRIPYRLEGQRQRVEEACNGVVGVLTAMEAKLDTETPTSGPAGVAVRRAIHAGLWTAGQVAEWAYDSEHRSQLARIAHPVLERRASRTI